MFLFGKPNLDKAYLTAVRLAFAVFLIGNWIGGQMIQHGGHTIGLEDGGDGLPFLSWSTLGGDLRVGHFLGLHAIQIIPLFACLLQKKTSLNLMTRTILSVVFAIGYGALVWFLYQGAMAGKPLVSS